MTVKHIISPKEEDIGDFSVRRSLPKRHQRMIGPWIFFDHMGPAEFEPGSGINVRPHPHINLATVTYLFEGEILHRDSLGNTQLIQPGAINLMVAGKGITHSERERDCVRHSKHRLHGLQLWHALPESVEETEPAFYHYPASEVPRLQVDGVSVNVLMGSAYGVTSPVLTYADTVYLEARLPVASQLPLPQCEALGLYVVAGEIILNGGETVHEHTMAVIEPSQLAVVQASSDTHLIIIGGDFLGERIIDWNFVSSRQDRVDQAKTDWGNGRFPLVVGDETEFVPLP